MAMSVVVVTASQILSCFFVYPPSIHAAVCMQQTPLPALGGLLAPCEPQFPHLAGKGSLVGPQSMNCQHRGLVSIAADGLRVPTPVTVC